MAREADLMAYALFSMVETPKLDTANLGLLRQPLIDAVGSVGFTPKQQNVYAFHEPNDDILIIGKKNPVYRALARGSEIAPRFIIKVNKPKSSSEAPPQAHSALFPMLATIPGSTEHCPICTRHIEVKKA
jgi:hypothetical protein